MRLMRYKTLLWPIFLVLLAACGSHGVEEPVYEENYQLDAQAKLLRSRITTQDILDAERNLFDLENQLQQSIEERLRLARLAEMRALRADNLILFTPDGNIAEESLSVIERHAAYLTSNSYLRFRLDAYSTTGGTRSTNLGRAEELVGLVWLYLEAYDIAKDRVQVVSYGEEDFIDRDALLPELKESLLQKRDSTAFVIIRY